MHRHLICATSIYYYYYFFFFFYCYFYPDTTSIEPNNNFPPTETKIYTLPEPVSNVAFIRVGGCGCVVDRRACEFRLDGQSWSMMSIGGSLRRFSTPTADRPPTEAAVVAITIPFCPLLADRFSSRTTSGVIW